MATRKKGGAGGKLNRSEVVTVRLDPRLRYGVELAARKQRRTASSFIEWAIEQTLKEVRIHEGDPDGNWSVTADEVLTKVWDPYESDRFVKLALRFPELLNHEEQVLWKLIRECGLLWDGKFVTKINKQMWSWEIDEKNFLLKDFRKYWPEFTAVARGELTHDVLPEWIEEKPLDAPF